MSRPAHRATSLVLLIVFGGFSAVGPHWHVPAPTTARCQKGHEHDTHASQGELVEFCHSSCHSHGCTPVNTEIAADQFVDSGFSACFIDSQADRNECDHLNCTICQHYQSSSVETYEFQIAEVDLPCDVAHVSTSQVAVQTLSSPLARGPPMINLSDA